MVSKRNRHEQPPPSLPSERLSFSLFWATRFWSITTLRLVYAMLRIYLPREAVMILAKQYAIGSQELTIKLPQRYAKIGRSLRVNGPWFLYKNTKRISWNELIQTMGQTRANKLTRPVKPIWSYAWVHPFPAFKFHLAMLKRKAF